MHRFDNVACRVCRSHDERCLNYQWSKQICDVWKVLIITVFAFPVNPRKGVYARPSRRKASGDWITSTRSYASLMTAPNENFWFQREFDWCMAVEQLSARVYSFLSRVVKVLFATDSRSKSLLELERYWVKFCSSTALSSVHLFTFVRISAALKLNETLRSYCPHTQLI